MNSIPEALIKIVPVIRVTLDCYANNRELFPLQNVVYNLQMSTYWLKEAEVSIPSGDDLITVNENAVRPLITTPTLLTTQEHFNYIVSELRALHTEVDQYVATNSLPDVAINSLKQGNNRIMEALFSIEIATHHYEQLRQQPGNYGGQ